MNLKLLLIIFLSALSTTNVLAQEKKTITGIVRDAAGIPLPGVSINEKGSTTATSTDNYGKFTIRVNANATLRFSFLGFTSQEITIGNNATINVKLLEDAKALNEVVVTALGIKKEKRQLGYSVTEVKGDVLAKSNEINPINSLQGRVAGVQIDQGAGGLFGNAKIVIRGNSTLGKNNQPIFVVDGVIMDNDVFEGTGRDFGNDLKDLNTDNFETVSILKGSAAAALYGSRAINGVVLITTKKGSLRKGIGITVNHATSISNPYSGPDFQNEFGGGSVGAFFTDNRDPNYQSDNWTTKVFPINPSTGLPYIDKQIGRELENWGPRMLGQDVTNYDGTPTKYLPQPNNYLDAFQNGVGNNTNVALEGGTENSTFRLTYNHNDAKGVTRNNNLTKNAFDLRATHNFNKKISADASIAYTNFNGKNPPRLGGLDAFGSFNLGHMYTWVLPRNYDTNYWIQKDKYTSILGGAPDPNNANEPNDAPESRFWYALYNNNYTQNEQLFRGRAAVTAVLTDWAKLVLEGNFNNIYTRTETSELGLGINFTGGSYSLGFSNKQSNTLKAMLMINKDISKDLTLNGYIGGESQRNRVDFESSSTSGGLLYPGGFFISNSFNPPTVKGGVLSKKNYNSMYASADLGYKNMLFLQATWRGDWSSALTYSDGSGNNFYNYPAASLSWVFSETFKTLPSWISFGKLRTNISALGNDTAPFTLNSGFLINGFTNANGGTVPISTYNSSTVNQLNLKPERKIAKEIGLEMRFLKSRLGLDLSLYQDNTKNQIINIGTPVESGVGAILINAGNIQNKGIELAIDAIP